MPDHSLLSRIRRDAHVALDKLLNEITCNPDAADWSDDGLRNDRIYSFVALFWRELKASPEPQPGDPEHVCHSCAPCENCGRRRCRGECITEFLLLAVDRTEKSDVIVWWGPNRAGYVECVDRAGRYTFAEAMRLSANCDDPIAVPLSDVDAGHFVKVERHARKLQLAEFRAKAAHARELFNA